MKIFFFHGLSFLLCCTLIAQSVNAQRASADFPPDYAIYLAPLASCGFSLGNLTVAQRGSVHSGFSYDVGFISAIIDNYQTFHFAPTVGLLYDSRCIKYTREGEFKHTVTINSIGILAGVAFPFIQIHLGMNIPVGGYQAQEVSTDKSLVTTIHPKDLKITFEPRIILYFPIPLGSDDKVIVPYCSLGYQLTKNDLPIFSISDLRISTIQLGLSFPLKIYEHYSGYSL